MLFSSPTRPNLALLQDPKKFELEQRARIADFIQKQGAAFGRLEYTPTLSRIAPVKAPFHVTEQLAFDQGLRNGRTIDGKKRLIFSGY